MRMFQIYHLIGNINQQQNGKPRMHKLVCEIEALGLNTAFMKTQNDVSNAYAKLGIRSTKIGDCILDGERMYMVQNVGFREVTRDSITIIP